MAVRRGMLFVMFALASAAHAQHWNNLGPRGGSIRGLLADPSVPGRVYASGVSVYVSSDAGRNWTSASAGLPGTSRSPLALIADAGRPGRLYLLDIAGRLMRSDDYAQSWVPTGYVVPASDLALGRRTPLVSLPGGADSLLLAPGNGYIYKSTDAGASFVPLSYVGYDGRDVATLAVDPTNPQVVYAGMGGSSINGPTLLRSGNGGSTWSGASGTPTIGTGSSIVFVPGGPVVAALNGRVHVLATGAPSWTATEVSAQLLAVSPGAGHEVVAMTATRCATSSDFTAGAQSCESGLPASSAYSGLADLVAVADGGAYRALANDYVAAVRAMEPATASWSDSNGGLGERNLRGLALVPGDPARMFVGFWSSSDLSGDMPLFSTNDGGASWQSHFSGTARYIRALALDPTTASLPSATRIYAGGLYVAENFQPLNSGLYRSVDGGQSWSSIGAGFPYATDTTLGNIGLIRKLVLDPRSCAQPPATGPCRQGPLTTVFAIGSREGWRVSKGMQGGDAWVSGDNGLPLYRETDVAKESIFPIDLDVDAGNGDLFLGAFSLVTRFDGTPGIGTIVSGVFRSTDGGIHWEHRSNGVPLMTGSTQTTRDVYAVATHPRRPGVVWISSVEPGGSSRIYKSTDRGANWFASGPELTGCDVRELHVDRAAPDVIYAAGTGVGAAPACIYRSEDGGTNWHAVVADAPFGELYDLRWDENDQKRLIMTTANGLWELRTAPDGIFVSGLDD